MLLNIKAAAALACEGLDELIASSPSSSSST